MASAPVRQRKKLPPRDPAVTSRIMAAVRGKDSKAELGLRRALFAMGLRYRVNDTGVYGRPDIVFRRERVAVFVDGDFWHGNAWRVRGFPSFDDQFRHWRRPGFWSLKIRRNVERDQDVNATLRANGWIVLRFWESALEKGSEKPIRRVVSAVARRRARLAK